MLRRTVLQVPVLAGLAQIIPDGFRLSVRVEALFPKLTLPQQIEKVAEAGYQGFEFGDWRAADARQITRLKNKLGLECACIVGNRGVNPKGMGLCNPGERDGFLAEIKASLEAAKRFETSRLVVLTGDRVAGMSREKQRASIVEGLKRGRDLVGPHGVTLIVEVVNTLAEIEPLHPQSNHLDYYLDRASEAFKIVREVSSPYVKVLFDIYHVQIMEGNLIESIRKNIAWIGHFHVGDVPGRHEPGTGEIHYGNVFKAIRETAFHDFVAMEYVPTKDAMITLAEVRRLI
jgi:hydroxypyruvate isomerase